MALPKQSPYIALAGALWGDVISADTMLHMAALALDLNRPKEAREYIARAQAATLRGLGRNALQFESLPVDAPSTLATAVAA